MGRIENEIRNFFPFPTQNILWWQARGVREKIYVQNFLFPIRFPPAFTSS